jgi:hypothetical protein
VTTIAYRSGIIAADSRVTVSTENGGGRKHLCTKLYRKSITEGRRTFDVIIGTAGEAFSALVFVDWYGTGKPMPDVLRDLGGDFTCLILRPDGLYEADVYCRPDKITEDFYAVGSGSKEALAAMHCGKSAAEAVRIAALIDPYTGGRTVSMSLDQKTEVKPKVRRKPD